ncbi:MAG: FdhC protein [Candidatus Cloacimonadota bacterium]|nr:MAG: FdhC protein [Candidatus Cloacimonadota bacterium]PIE80170.1 MAG: FdhC protein [Candidatus Delongbacteria bacterium]
MVNSPKEISEIIIDQGIGKANKKFYKTFLLGFSGGLFISLASIGSIVMYAYAGDHSLGKFLAGSVFSLALMFVVLAGGEFFTGNNLMTLGFLEKKYRISLVAKNLIAVFLGNFAGCLLMVGINYYGGAFGYEAEATKLSHKIVVIAEAKAHLTFIEALMRGIMCNMLVAGAIWMQASSKDVAGKVLTIFFPIVGFIVSGFEHVVANMFYIPMGMALGADVSVLSLFGNIIPVAFGNMIAGSFIIPVMYYFIYRKQ